MTTHPVSQQHGRSGRKIPTPIPPPAGAAAEITSLPLSVIRPGTSQPRKKFSQEEHESLVLSIRVHGIIENLVVRKKQGHYSIVCGERRYRAASEVGLENVPVRIVEADDQEAFILALNENIARESLSFLDEANAYRELLTLKKVRSQAGLAELVGVAQSRISQRLSLLQVPPELVELLEKGAGDEGLSERHVRALARIKDDTLRASLTDRVRKEHISSEETEALVAANGGEKKRAGNTRTQRSWTSLGNLRYHTGGGAFHIRIKKSATFADVVRELEGLIRSLRDRGEGAL